MGNAEIIKALKVHKKQITTIINGLEDIDKSNDSSVNRKLVNTVTFTLFELIDSLVNTEIDIYNYMNERRK